MRSNLYKGLTILSLVMLATLIIAVENKAAPSSSYDLSWWVVAGGGAPSNADSITMNGTLGQPVAGTVSGELNLCSGFYCFTDASPTAVFLASFTTTAQEQAVLLEWETASEIDNLGFNLYRCDSPDGTPAQLNEELIPSQVPGSFEGAYYSWLDETIETGITYFYWLDDVDIHSVVTRHGPGSATVGASGDQQIYLPIMQH